MKANELMIGDWVFVHKPACKGHRVDYINEMDEEIGADGEIYNVCDIFPIPLTPEILEKNGWKNCAPNVWQNEYRGFFFYWENGTGRFGMDDFRRLQEQWKMHLQIKHIHQLQHTLRLCGIEKEIEL